MAAKKVQNVDDYLRNLPSPEDRAALETLRTVIRNAAPQASETISYGIPTFKQGGFLCGIAAFKNHCSFFPGHTVASFEQQLKGFKTRKGTIQFTADKPLPKELVERIVRARIAENENF